jgi:hypothetical protein
MSDVTAAPTPNPTPQTSNSSSEVPVDVNPVVSPQPVGSQAPEKPVALNERQQAIQRAFDRANERSKDPQKQARPAERKAEPKPAEAKPGHNEPPEKTEKFDLKKPPSRADQPRDRGRFASRTSEPQGEIRKGHFDEQAGRVGSERSSGQNDPTLPGQNQNAHRQLPAEAAFRDPPARMAEHAKRDWHAVPESVRGEIGRMHQEFGVAYQQYRGDYETMNTIRHFHQMAQQHGTTLQQALTNYVSMEQKLRNDLIGGLDTIINNLGLPRSDGQKATLIDVAAHILNQSPEQHRLTAQSNAQVAQNHQIGALHQEIAGLKGALNQWQTGQQFVYLRQGIDQYAETHPRLDELADIIEQEISRGFDLDTAYRRADLLRPPHAAQTRTPSAQTRSTTDKSIHGAPDVAPSNGASRKSDKPVGRREAIQRAISRVNGSL